MDFSAQTNLIFEAAKQSPDALLAFLKMMPKSADLHHHLDGSCYYEDVLDFAIEHELQFDTAQGRFVESTGAGHTIAASELQNDAGALLAFQQAFSASGWQPGSGKSSFFSVFGALASVQYPEGLMLHRLLQRSASENIFYEEIIAPVIPPEVVDELESELPQGWENDLGASVSLLSERLAGSGFAASVRARLDEWEQAASGIPNSGRAPVFRFLGYALRNDSRARFFAASNAIFAATLADHRVVGYSMAGGEDLPSSLEDFDFHLNVLTALGDHFGPIRATLHTGELTPSDCEQVVLDARIRRSVLEGRAGRIGHGVSIKWESEPERTFDLLRTNSVAVEICLSSNEIILEVEPGGHPVRDYIRAEVPVVI